MRRFRGAGLGAVSRFASDGLLQPYWTPHVRQLTVGQGPRPEAIQQLLGDADLDHTDAYLDVKAEVLEAMFAGAL